MLENTDDLTLLDSNDDVIDYVAWGDDAGDDDDDAVSIGKWTNSEYVDSSLFIENQTLGRDKDSNDTDLPSDWENATSYADPFGVDRSTENGSSPGAQNIDFIIPEFSDVFIPVIAIIALFVTLRKKARKKSKLEGNTNGKNKDRT